MAAPGIKFDDGTGGFATNCFPVRTLISQNDETSSGAWLTAQRAEERRRFKALICSKPKTYDEIRGERRHAERDDTEILPPYKNTQEEEEDECKTLDGFFLMKHCCIEDPVDLCSVNISGQGLSEAKEEDLQLFDNVAYINASENILPLEPFRSFPILRELELSLNGLRGPSIQPTDFPQLEMLDLSYNNLASDDILPLGLIPNLKILHLTGNSLRTLPANMARPHLDEKTFERIARFRSLEILLLEDNKLSDHVVFAALAGLRRLKHLDLSKNQIRSVPQLLLLEGRHVTQEAETKKKHGRRSRPSSRRSNRSGRSTPLTDDKNKSKSNINLAATEQSQKEATSSISKGSVDLVLSSTSIGVAPGEKTSDNMLSSVIVEQEEEGADLSAMPSMGDLGELSDMKLDELDLTQMSENILASMPASKSNTRVADDQDGDAFERAGDGDFPLPPPFPELRHLNLAHNKISEEEALLPVAAWPMFSELIIHDNPLTLHNSGDPPLIKRFLRDRLGISIHRKRQDDPPKPHIEVPAKTERKVVMKILPVPRCNVQELLALEAPKAPSILATPQTTPKPTPHSTPQNTTRENTTLSMERTTPLPPIPTSPHGGSTEQAFFMTQVDEAGNEVKVTAKKSQQPPANKPAMSNTSHTSSHNKHKNTSRYQGYEALLETDETTSCDDVPMPKDLPGNIRALQYALAHPLVFRDNPPDLQVPQPPYRPLMKNKPAPPGRPHRTRPEQISDALTGLKSRSAVVEMELKTVLDKKHGHKDFSEADQLLGRLKSSYSPTSASPSPTPTASFPAHSPGGSGCQSSTVARRSPAALNRSPIPLGQSPTSLSPSPGLSPDMLKRRGSRRKSVTLAPVKNPVATRDNTRAGVVFHNDAASRLNQQERAEMDKGFEYWMERWDWLFVGNLL